MPNFYGSRYYNSDGTPKTPTVSASNLGVQVPTVSQAISTTMLGTATNRVYLVPLPAAGPRTFLGTFVQGTDMDSNGSPTLATNLVLIYSINGVEQTPVIVVNMAGLGIPLTAAVPLTWVDIAQAMPNNADGPVHLVLLINTAAATAAAGTLTLIPFYQ